MFTFFKKTKELELKIDEFLDLILSAALEFQQGMKYYVDNRKDEFIKKVKEVDAIEGKADALRREIENRLYSEMLIPEARGDVLALLENSDDVLNVIADTIVEFSIEKPDFPSEILKDFENLVEVCIKSVEEMVHTMRAYFKDITAVRVHITKTMFYEKESDKIGEKIKRYLFGSSKLNLSKRMHLRTFITYLQNIADMAEDIGDRISIYAIKREI